MRSLRQRWLSCNSTASRDSLGAKSMKAVEPAHIVFLDRDTMPAEISLRPFAFPYELTEIGQFCYFDHPINDLSGATLGIIGDGALGRAVAEIGRAFGMRTLFSSYKGVSGMGPLYTPFLDVLRQSDVITLHAPLMPQTR